MKLVNFTCEWRTSQLEPPLVASLCWSVLSPSVGSYVVGGTVVNWSQVTLEIFTSHANFCQVTQVTRGGRAQVVGRSLIGRKKSQVSRGLVESVSRSSSRGRGSRARVYADRLTNGVRGSRARKSVLVPSQVTLITWPVEEIFQLVNRF